MISLPEVSNRLSTRIENGMYEPEEARWIRDLLQIAHAARLLVPCLESFLDRSAPSDNEQGISGWAIEWSSVREMTDELKSWQHSLDLIVEKSRG